MSKKNIKKPSTNNGKKVAYKEEHNSHFFGENFIKKPMIGFREANVFHIVFIDNKFEVYKHS